MMVWRKMERRCRMCRGVGFLEDPHCHLCKRRITGEDDHWRLKAETLPCGHSTQENLVTAVPCLECWGKRKSIQWVSPAEWHTLRRTWRRRLVGVTFGMLFLLVFPLVVVLATPLHEEVCGSWWYFAIPLMLFSRFCSAGT